MEQKEEEMKDSDICTQGTKYMRCGKHTVKSIPIKTRDKTEQKQKLILCEKNQKLATTTIADYGTALNLSHGRAFIKHHGYAKQLITCLIKKHPDVWLINTDGFTKQGHPSFKKAMEKNNFRIVDWRWSGAGGYARALRQDVIDQIIEKQEKGAHFIYYVDPKFHSRNKEKK
jgi:hypothetical protein